MAPKSSPSADHGTSFAVFSLNPFVLARAHHSNTLLKTPPFDNLPVAIAIWHFSMPFDSPDVEFCGYSAPHPSEPKIHLRIQMYDDLSAISCLFSALSRLRELFTTIEEAYLASLADEGGYVKEEDVDVKAEVEKVRKEGEERRRQAQRNGQPEGGDVEMA